MQCESYHDQVPKVLIVAAWRANPGSLVRDFIIELQKRRLQPLEEGIQISEYVTTGFTLDGERTPIGSKESGESLTEEIDGTFAANVEHVHPHGLEDELKPVVHTSQPQQLGTNPLLDLQTGTCNNNLTE